jgi:hypothetical protein
MKNTKRPVRAARRVPSVGHGDLREKTPTERLPARQIAAWMWRRDGKPDGHALGEANRRTYDREAVDVLRAIRALGFRVVGK